MVQEAEDPSPVSTFGPAHYDVAIVGSSPMNMIAALMEQAGGKRVLVVDGAEEVGGTWKVTELLGYSNVELGCHQLDAIRPVYQLLEDLGIELAVMEPQPIYVSVDPWYFPKQLNFNDRWIREFYDLFANKKNYDLFWVENSLRSKLRAGVRVARHATRALRRINRPSKYPPFGATQIVQRLDDLARAAGVDVRCSTWMSDVAIDRAANRVRFKINGNETTASKLHLNSSSNIGAIQDGAERIDLESHDSCWQTLYLSLHDCPRPPFSYAVFADPKLLHRASDLSRYAVPSKDVPNARLIALTIDEAAPETEETALESLRQLKDMGLINPDARLEAFTYLPYTFVRVDEWKRREVEDRLEPLVSLHETSLLTPSIASLMHRHGQPETLSRVRKLAAQGAGA